MDKWRPKDWPERRATAIKKVILDIQQDKESAFVDAGADAMYELAYAKGRKDEREALASQEHQDWLATLEGETCEGTWVFIPEEIGFQLEEK